MAERTCTVDECQRPHLARGMCSSHYGAWHRHTYGRKTEMFVRTCIVCDSEWVTRRPKAKYCSDECKGHAYRRRTVCRLPRHHPVMVLLNPPRPRPVERDAECEWCGTPFTTTKSTQRMCSTECKAKAKRCRRRGRAAGSTSHYTWAGVMRLFLAMNRCCAYCDRPVVGPPDPDHVVPLSQGGSNSLTNILPCCRACNSDKRDLALDEWAASRLSRGLPPVRVDVDRFPHLCISPAA